jgi:NAD(P)-dependent dehydrogenase (short-subunit alcohol dehydrogenase family)
MDETELTSLEGRVIAIAGAGGNLGPTVVRRLAPTGARLALGGRHRTPLDELAAANDVEADTAEVDLLDPASAAGWASGLAERFDRIDALVHLVGGWRGGQPIDEAPLEDWALLHDLLIRTVQHTSRAFRAPLVASGRGRFALVSARAAAQPTHTNAAYAAAKAAAEAWTLALADSFADEPATANIVVINALVTPEMRAASPEKPFKTFTDAADIAAALAYLCSDAASKMNGRRLILHP